jgi:hypothetical protein
MTLSFALKRIEQWPLEPLKPYVRNAKTHRDDKVAKIAGSMAQFGWTVSVLVADVGKVIAGNGRNLAAAYLGLSEAPGIVLDHLTEGQGRAYRLADSKLIEFGAWDEALLAGTCRSCPRQTSTCCWSSSPTPSSTNCSPSTSTWRMVPATAARSSPKHRRSRSAGRATSGCSGRIDCSAATRLPTSTQSRSAGCACFADGRSEPNL